MQIQLLSLKNFRNHKNFKWRPSSRINCFYGDNGKGKTAVLEAASLLLLRRSFRPGKGWVQKNFDQSFLKLDFKKEEGQGSVKLCLQGNKISKYFINEKKTNVCSLKHYGVFITPLDLNVVRGEALFRRKILDELVFELPQGGVVLKDFQKILIQKNKFLKLCKKGAYSLYDKKMTIDALNEVFLQKSQLLMEKRQEALLLFDPFWKEKAQEFLQTTDLESIYVGKNKKPIYTEKQIKVCLEEELDKEKEAEFSRGVCLAGPQRHDLLFFWKGHEAREFLSQGQQKSLLITWKLGQWAQNFKRTKEPPVLFFDDIFSEIDQQVSQKLTTFLLSLPGQSFLTFTQRTPLLDQAHSCFFE